MDPQEIALLIYNLSLLPIIFFSVIFVILTMLNIFFVKEKEVIFKKFKNLPFITVQIPTYNDPIAERCVKQCIQFDYPKDKYEIIIADDSTNIETQNILKKFEVEHPGFVKYIHRNIRHGFKAGALKNSMNSSKGEFFVLFDSDWIPNKDFLKKIIQPFSDPMVAIVQTRQGVYNKQSNLITRFASYMLMIYHTIIMPINNKINCVFFCGTAGAIRRSAFDEVGGWNLNSVTEDSDLSLNLLMKGYKSIYLEFETPSEVPKTFESFIKQQMRWCYGNTRVFLDNAYKILLKKGLTLKQRSMVIFLTLGNMIAPLVFIMTLAGFTGWFLGEPTLLNFSDLINLLSRFLLTAGFIFIGAFTLYKNQLLKEFPYLILSVFTMGLLLAVANSIAFSKAILNKQLSWFCTTKEANEKFV